MFPGAKSILQKFARNRDGATAIEAAICLPIVLMLMFGCFQYGMFFNNATALSHSFQEASREVKLLEDPTNAELQALYQSKLADVDSGRVVMTVQRVTRYGETFVEVNVTYAHTIDIPLLDQYPLTSTYSNLVMIADES